MNDQKKKIPRSTWLPALLLIYLVGMTAMFGPQLVAEGEIWRLVLTILAEIVIILLLRYLLLKKERK